MKSLALLIQVPSSCANISQGSLLCVFVSKKTPMSWIHRFLGRAWARLRAQMVLLPNKSCMWLVGYDPAFGSRQLQSEEISVGC